MKNIIPALIAIVVGFALSSFVLNTYSSDILKKDNANTTKKVAKTKKKKKATPLKSSKKETTTKSTAINTNNIQGSFDNWNAYTKKNIDLMSTFTPIDEKGAITHKGIFLTLLRTGGYIPVKSVKDGKTQYQLKVIEKTTDEKIKKAIVGKATVAHHYFRMEGKKLPDYDFVDLKGKPHNKADNRGKLLVLKCWFINCKVCVEEFPQLNALVDKYKDDKIEFVSLAFDEKDKLVKFLETKPFKYATIPQQKKYMSKKLKVKQYPTHLIVDSNGVIIKMVNNVNTLTQELKRIMGK